MLNFDHVGKQTIQSLKHLQRVRDFELGALSHRVVDLRVLFHGVLAVSFHKLLPLLPPHALHEVVSDFFHFFDFLDFQISLKFASKKLKPTLAKFWPYKFSEKYKNKFGISEILACFSQILARIA